MKTEATFFIHKPDSHSSIVNKRTCSARLVDVSRRFIYLLFRYNVTLLPIHVEPRHTLFYIQRH